MLLVWSQNLVAPSHPTKTRPSQELRTALMRSHLARHGVGAAERACQWVWEPGISESIGVLFGCVGRKLMALVYLVV